MIINELKNLEQGKTSTKLVKYSMYDSKEIMDNGKNITLKEYGIFNKKHDHRYYLKINICKNNNKKKNLIVIMLNPSQSGSKLKDTFVDKTITNVVKIANDNNYNEITILNLFSEVEPKSKKVDFSKVDEDNLKFLKEILEETNDKILVAWGWRFKNNNNKIKDLIKVLQNKPKEQVVTFADKIDFPKHPGRISIEYIRKKFGSNNKAILKPYKF